jgi:ABC-type lipoprotein export system ATPase subunit
VIGKGPEPTSSLISSSKEDETRIPVKDSISSARAEALRLLADNPLVRDFEQLAAKLESKPTQYDLRIKDGSFKVTRYYEEKPTANAANGEAGNRRAKQKIATVRNQSPLFAIFQKVKRIFKTGKLCEKLDSEDQYIMKNVNLAFESGNMYLVLGAPGSGKSTLLKMIAGNLQKSKDHEMGGTVSINNITPDSDIIWSNLVGYIDQIDRLHPFLTVFETCEFAWRCRSAGTHKRPLHGDSEAVNAEVKKMDDALFLVHKVLQGLGLTRVSDTFVGDQETVRGVSGGEKKRVTVAEMAVCGFSVLCADEISTGLDGTCPQSQHRE